MHRIDLMGNMCVLELNNAIGMIYALFGFFVSGAPPAGVGDRTAGGYDASSVLFEAMGMRG